MTAVQSLRHESVAVSTQATALGRTASWRWEWVLIVLATVAAAVAVWVTLRAGFLAHPGWAAVQKADFILGPVGVGLYWHHRRPGNRLGLLLIVLGMLGAPYIFQSATSPLLFGIGVFWQFPIAAMTQAVILAFPGGRLGAVERAILAVGALGGGAPWVAVWLTSPQFAQTFSISGCRTVCPGNGAAISSPLSFAPQLGYAVRSALIVMTLATACLLVWKFVSGTPPRRRALAIGGPIALLYVLMWAAYQSVGLLTPGQSRAAAGPIKSVLDWTFAGARSSIWYGFLLALVAAELFAGRVLRDVVRRSLRRPSVDQLQAMLREPLGDPALRLGFWRPTTGDFVGTDGEALKSSERSSQALTEVRRDGQPAAAILHDKQLTEDPELLEAAGAVTLLALENAELEAAWRTSLRELAESRARIVQTSDRERRKLERDLHDGAQQRLVAALLRLDLARALTGDRPELGVKLAEAEAEVEKAIDDLRDLAHGIYPPVLADRGLAGAIDLLADRFAGTVSVSETTDRRFAPEVEAAFYYCCLEAIQNAAKYAGREARIEIRLYTSGGELTLETRDNGVGFDVADAHDGVGLQNMRDRLGAVGGDTEIRSAPGRGTVVIARAPLGSGQARPLRSRPGSSWSRRAADDRSLIGL